MSNQLQNQTPILRSRAPEQSQLWKFPDDFRCADGEMITAVWRNSSGNFLMRRAFAIFRFLFGCRFIIRPFFANSRCQSRPAAHLGRVYLGDSISLRLDFQTE